MVLNMKPSSQLDTRAKLYELVILSLCTAILFISQIALSFLPNIELVSLLIIIFSIFFGKKVLYVVYSFALLEGFFYGFGLWWYMYLYIWNILVLVSIIFKSQKSSLFWAMISGFYGLLFGFFSSFVFFFVGFLGLDGSANKGISLMFSYWINGIPFDIIHCIGNFFVALVLFKPLFNIFKLLIKLRKIH